MIVMPCKFTSLRWSRYTPSVRIGNVLLLFLLLLWIISVVFIFFMLLLLILLLLLSLILSLLFCRCYVHTLHFSGRMQGQLNKGLLVACRVGRAVPGGLQQQGCSALPGTRAPRHNDPVLQAWSGRLLEPGTHSAGDPDGDKAVWGPVCKDRRVN
jgi:hypothetical protein